MPMTVKCNLICSYMLMTHAQLSKVRMLRISKTSQIKILQTCHWFADSKLSIHFDGDKTKSILFASKRQIKKLQKLEIIYIQIKQHSRVTYPGCILEERMSGESMAHNVISKVNARLKFLHRENKYLTPNMCLLLCNALIQPHFDYACSAQYPNLSKKLKNRIQTSQKKCIGFCLQLDEMSYISQKECETIIGCPLKEDIISA